MRFKLVKAKSVFTLMSAAVQFKHYELMHFCEKGASVTGCHAGSFSRSNEIQWNLPISHVVVKNYSIPAQSRVYSQDNLSGEAAEIYCGGPWAISETLPSALTVKTLKMATRCFYSIC